jgi:hypothetical protein
MVQVGVHTQDVGYRNRSFGVVAGVSENLDQLREASRVVGDAFLATR